MNNTVFVYCSDRPPARQGMCPSALPGRVLVVWGGGGGGGGVIVMGDGGLGGVGG